MERLKTEQAYFFIVGFACGIFAMYIGRKLTASKTTTTTNKNSKRGGSIEYDSFNENPSSECKLVLVVRNDLKMGKGKAAAQCAHASVMAHEDIRKKNPKLLSKWKNSGQPKIVVKIETQEEMMKLAQKAKKADLPVNIVQDAGRTQIERGSKTVMAVGPGSIDVINLVTGHLKLY